jgi:hypothetical protein
MHVHRVKEASSPLHHGAMAGAESLFMIYIKDFACINAILWRCCCVLLFLVAFSFLVPVCVPLRLIGLGYRRKQLCSRKQKDLHHE